MSEKKPAPGGGRKQWDKSEWEAKAKAKDEAFAEQAKSAEAAMKQGKKPRYVKEDLPVPTEKMKAREEDLGLEKNLNKTMLVQTTTSGKGPKGAGYYCELCNRTFQDSLSYLDHVNGRLHLRRLGQTTQVERSTVAQVREKIRQLRESTASKVTAKNYDFKSRLDQVRKAEEEEKQKRREERKRKREAKREEEELSRMGIMKRSKVDEEDDDSGDVAGLSGKLGKKVNGTQKGGKRANGDGADAQEVVKAQQDHDDMAAMMGFGGFGGVKKR